MIRQRLYRLVSAEKSVWFCLYLLVAAHNPPKAAEAWSAATCPGPVSSSRSLEAQAPRTPALPLDSFDRLPWLSHTPPRATKQLLDNGLTVIVLENHTAPVVAVRIYVKTGSIFEGEWLGAGISHLFEHALSEGTKTRSKDQINAMVAEVGGQSNAYTSKDETCYHITTASRYFEKTVDILSDELKNAIFPEKEVETQKGVIRNEMAMGDDDPDRALYALFEATAWREHPNRFPIIGYREVFDQLTRQDILDYYHSHYVPDNTIVVVAGDVETKQAMEVLEKAFSDWERRPIPQATLPTEPPQQGPRRVVKEMDVQVAQMLMGFHTVPISHPDLYPLDVLAMILGRGESSRLSVRIQQRAQLVHSIGAWSATPGYEAGYFGVKATVEADKLEAAEKAILQEIGQLKTSFVSEAELAKAKRQNEASFIFSKQSVESQASQLASDEMSTGDINFSQTYVANINKVTRQDLRRVVRQYFQPDNYTVAIIKPRSSGTGEKATVESGKVGEIEKVSLANGMTLLLRENHSNPTVNFLVAFLAGTRYETEANNGVSRLTASLLTRGTKTRSGEQIAEMMEAIGGSIDGFSGNNSLGVSGQVLKQDFDQGLEMLVDVLTRPTFPQAELDRLRAESLAGLKRQEDDPFSRALLGMRRILFQDHPYRFNGIGTKDSLAKMSRQTVLDFYQKTVKPQGAVMAVFGDFDAAAAKSKIEKALQGFQGKPVKVEVSAPSIPSHPLEETEEKEGIQQTVIVYGFPGLTISDKDRYALDVLDGALSGIDLPGGRLHARLRDNQLVYVVHAYGQAGLEPGAFIIYAATQKRQKETVLKILQEEVSKIITDPITSEELARAKVMCITAHELGQEASAQQAQQSAYDQLYGMGYEDSRRYAERIESVTSQDVLRVARRILRLEQSVRVVVEPKK